VTPERVIGVIQARVGSSRLPGKVLAGIGGLPLVRWTIEAMASVPGIEQLIVATTTEPEDDQLVEALEGVVPIHRGPTYDVLTRCWEAVEPFGPTIVVRQTADNPFVDPVVVASQIERLIEGGFDFVGNAGWPLGIAAEVARAAALRAAFEEAREPAEREHVMPFLYARPQRFAIGSLSPPAQAHHPRYTVDTEADLVFARAVAERLGHGPPVRFEELEGILEREPGLASLNADVTQKPWREVDTRGP